MIDRIVHVAVRLEGFVYAGVLLAALLACKTGSSGDGPAPSEKRGEAPATAAAPAAEKPIPVSAVDLHAAYHANEVAADDRYKDKLIGVAGLVTSIQKDPFDNMIVSLDTKMPLQEVRATMKDTEKARVATLAKGQAAALICRGGGMVLGSPVLRDCTVFADPGQGK